MGSSIGEQSSSRRFVVSLGDLQFELVSIDNLEVIGRARLVQHRNAINYFHYPIKRMPHVIGNTGKRF